MTFMADIRSHASMHDTIDVLADEIARLHGSLSARGVRVHGQQLEPAAAWASDSVARGQVLPVNQATTRALTGAAAALRDAEWRAILGQR
jgi:hypothetical protein